MRYSAMILIKSSSRILHNTVEECCLKMLKSVGHRDSIVIQSVCGSHIPRFQCMVVQTWSNSIALHCAAFVHVKIPVTCWFIHKFRSRYRMIIIHLVLQGETNDPSRSFQGFYTVISRVIKEFSISQFSSKLSIFKAFLSSRRDGYNINISLLDLPSCLNCSISGSRFVSLLERQYQLCWLAP